MDATLRLRRHVAVALLLSCVQHQRCFASSKHACYMRYVKRKRRCLRPMSSGDISGTFHLLLSRPSCKRPACSRASSGGRFGGGAASPLPVSTSATSRSTSRRSREIRPLSPPKTSLDRRRRQHQPQQRRQQQQQQQQQQQPWGARGRQRTSAAGAGRCPGDGGLGSTPASPRSSETTSSYCGTTSIGRPSSGARGPRRRGLRR